MNALITSVSLKGFQSHADTSFNLGKGLNVITGPSDAGKTAIIRAVRWVAFNEPQGEAFVNEAVGFAEVKIFLANDAIITKTRRQKKTSYLIQVDEVDEGSLFEKSEVPLEVTRLLGIEKHSFGDFEAALNFSFQLDAPFLISETASAGAKVLGKLAGTESVDLAIKGVSRDTYAARNLRAQAEKDMERITGSLFEYEGIDDAQQMLETAEILLEQVESSNTKFDNLKTYHHEYLLGKERLDKHEQVLSKLVGIPKMIEDLAEIEKAQERYEILLHLKSEGDRLQERITVLGQTLQKFEDLPTANEYLDNTSKAVERLSNNISLYQSYQKYEHDVKKAENVLKKTLDLMNAAYLLDSVEKTLNHVRDLRVTKGEYLNSSNNLRALNETLDRFKEVHVVEEILTAVNEDEKRFAVLSRLKSELLSAHNVSSKARYQLNAAENALQEAAEVLQNTWDESGGVCPLCESAVNKCCEHD